MILEIAVRQPKRCSPILKSDGAIREYALQLPELAWSEDSGAGSMELFRDEMSWDSSVRNTSSHTRPQHVQRLAGALHKQPADCDWLRCPTERMCHV